MSIVNPESGPASTVTQADPEPRQKAARRPEDVTGFRDCHAPQAIVFTVFSRVSGACRQTVSCDEVCRGQDGSEDGAKYLENRQLGVCFDHIGANVSVCVDAMNEAERVHALRITSLCHRWLGFLASLWTVGLCPQAIRAEVGEASTGEHVQVIGLAPHAPPHYEMRSDPRAYAVACSSMRPGTKRESSAGV